MDPLEEVRADHDSTFALMLECRRRGIEVLELRQEWLFVAGGRTFSRMRIVEVAREPGNHFRVIADDEAPLEALDVLFLRKDPPVDLDFLRATQLVELGPGPVWINHPRGLRAANEKLFALRFPDLVPPTLVSREIGQLREFLDAQGGDVVVKPLDGCGGEGVMRLRRGDPNLTTLLDHAVVTNRNPERRAMLRLGAGVMAGFRATLTARDFTEIQTPKIVAAATESGANVFKLGYFGRPAFLAQSPQFYKQIMVGVFERVFEVGPVFRAEPHDTTRHINEPLLTEVSFSMTFGIVTNNLPPLCG